MNKSLAFLTLAFSLLLASCSSSSNENNAQSTSEGESIVQVASMQQAKEPNARPFYGVSFIDKGNDYTDSYMPDAFYFLPAPPAPGDPLFINDSIQYFLNKEIRSTQRGDTAVWDAETSIEYFMLRFSGAIGKELTPEKYPILANTIMGVMQDVRSSIQKAKNRYARHRPYQHFQEHTPVPEDESPTDFTSYPSGHTVRGWAAAMLLVAVFPEHANAILNVGYQIGQSRVILGYHYQSDVEAARLAASAGFARLCAEQKFRDAIVECQKEVQSK